MSSTETKQFFYELSHTVFQWSLLYLLILFFLEDSKPFLVTGILNPHWFIVIVLFSAALLIVYASHAPEQQISTKKHVTLLDRWLVTIATVVVSILLFRHLYPFIHAWAFVVALVSFASLKKISLLLVNENTSLPTSLRLLMPRWMKHVQTLESKKH